MGGFYNARATRYIGSPTLSLSLPAAESFTFCKYWTTRGQHRAAWLIVPRARIFGDFSKNRAARKRDTSCGRSRLVIVGGAHNFCTRESRISVPKARAAAVNNSCKCTRHEPAILTLASGLAAREPARNGQANNPHNSSARAPHGKLGALSREWTATRATLSRPRATAASAVRDRGRARDYTQRVHATETKPKT